MTFTFVHSEVCGKSFLVPLSNKVLCRQKAVGIIGVIPPSVHTHISLRMISSLRLPIKVMEEMHKANQAWTDTVELELVLYENLSAFSLVIASLTDFCIEKTLGF